MKNSSDLPASEKCRLCGQVSNNLGQGPLLSLSHPSDYSPPPDTTPHQLSPPPARVFFLSWDSPEEDDRNCIRIHTRNYPLSQPLKVSADCEAQPSLIPDQVERIGMKRDDKSIEDNGRDHLQAHYQCAAWSCRDVAVCGEEEELWNRKVLDSISAAASQPCDYCHQNGAGIRCSAPDCAAYYHFPCALMQGVSMNFKCFELFCPKHSEISQSCCETCEEKGSTESKLLSCCRCGRHWHPRCLSVDDTTYLRAGWTCQACKVCQKCNEREDVSQLLICSSCDKAIHLSCTGLTATPSSEWRCEECRCCIDCDSKSAGNGPSCRWHGGYTICSRCNQLRSKGSYCFICQGAYKQVTDIPMIQCDYCQKWIHAKCDKINRQTYEMLGRPKSRYFCPECREAKGVNIFLASGETLRESSPLPVTTTESADTVTLVDDCTAGKTELEEIILVPDTMVVLQEGSVLLDGNSEGGVGDSLLAVGSETVVYEDDMDDKNLDKLDKSIELQTHEEFEASLKLNSGLTLFHRDSVSKRQKKRLILESYTPGVCISKERRPLSSSRLNLKRITVRNKKKNRLRNLLTSQLGLPKGALTNPFRNLYKDSRRKYYRGKELSGKPGLEMDHLPSFRPLVFPYTSKFLLYQKDLCACCGAGGQGKDSSLLVCAQCANSYHDYCLKTKVPASRLRHGWRCPKCASCEGCGLATDEACLLMCDQCDILYHTYCLKPPLRSVPKGPWKCSWCVKCSQCASDSPGINGTWQKDFTLCAPCGSRSSCHICSVNYQDGDLIMKCSLCKRWSHGSCDGFNSKSDIQKMVQKKYYCSLCRHLIREKGLKNLLPYKQYIGHKKESNPFKKLRKVRRGEQSLDANPSSQNSSFIDTGPADISSSIDQTVIEDMNLLSSMNKNYASGITLEHNPTATIIQQPRDILKSLDAPRKVKVPAGLIAKKKSLKAMREESRKQRKHERRMKARSTTEEDDNELDSFDKNILPHLTRYQKACLRWVMDEERGTLATKAPVLYANMSFNDLKDKYPAIYSAGWMDRARAVNNLWKKLPMTERQQYIDKAKLNREKLESEGVYQKRNPPRIIRLYAVKAFKLNQMTDQPQGLKRDFSTRRPRRTVAELQKAREEEDKVKKEIGMEDNKPRRKGRRVITGKKSSCFSGSKNRNGLHTPQSSFSYHGEMHPEMMYCPPLPDEKSPLTDHHFPYMHQPFQPLLHGTKGSGDHKSLHPTPSTSDTSLSKLSQPGLPYSSTSPNAHNRSLVSPICSSSSQPFPTSRPNTLDVTPHGHSASQSPHEFAETKPFKSSNSPYPQTTGSSRHILHNYPQQSYKSGSYPHSAPIQGYPHSPFHHHPGASNMQCYPQNPHGYNYHPMHANTPPYHGQLPYYYPHPHDPKFRPYSEQKHSSHPPPRTQPPINIDTPLPDKPDLCLDFSSLPPQQDTPRSSCSAMETASHTNGLSSDNRTQVSEQTEGVSLHNNPLSSDKSTAAASEVTSSLPANSLTPEQMRSHGKPPLQPHTPLLQSKYKHDLTPYHTPKYASPWGPPAYPDSITPGDEFKKPLTPSETAIRSGGSRKKGSMGISPDFPGYPYPYNESVPMGYQPPYYHSQDMSPYQSAPNSPFNMQPLNQYSQDPSQHAKFKHSRRLSNPLEYSPSPTRPAPKQLHRQGPHPFNPSSQSQSTSTDPSRQTYPSFPYSSISSQQSPIPNSPTSSKSHSLSEIPPFPKPTPKFNTVVLPSPSLERATTTHCVKTREHSDLIDHLERIATSCNKRELNYFDCLELTNMTAEHTHMIDSLSTDTKTRYSLYEELNSILEVRRSSILRRYSAKPVRLKKQYLTKVLVEPVVPLEILIPSLSFLWSSPDKAPSNSADFYNSFPSFYSHSDMPPLNVGATSTPVSGEDSLPDLTNPDTGVHNKPNSSGDSMTTPPDATSTPLTTQNSATSSLYHTVPTNSSAEEPLPLLATSSSAKQDSSLSDLNFSDCTSNPSEPEEPSSLNQSSSRKRHKSPESDSVEHKKPRPSPTGSDNNSSMSLLDLGVGAGPGEDASFSAQFQSLVQEMYEESPQFTIEKNTVSGIDIHLSLDQAIKEEMDSDKQEAEQPNTALLFKKKPRQTRATKWAVWSPDFYKAFLKSAASRKCRRHKLMPQLLSNHTVSYPDPDDERACMLCAGVSDTNSKEQGRLIAAGVDEWVHAGCVIWSEGVSSCKDGRLENVSQVIEKSDNNICTRCHKPRASMICFSCSKYYHLPCASLSGCHFYSDRSVECPEHYTSSDGEVSTFFTSTYLYIQYCDATMLDSVSASEGKLMLRVGNVIFLKIGQLCPKVKGTYTDACIYPVGYVCSRFYWSVNDPYQLSQYWCSITLEESLPLFSVYTIDRTQDPPRKLCIADKSIMVVWEKILEPIQSIRAAHGQISINKKTMKPEDFFGLSDPTIVKMIESLPGIEQMVGYNCKYPVRKPSYSLPIPYNPSGSARTELVPRAPLYRRHLIHRVASPTEASTPLPSSLPQGRDANKDQLSTPVHITPLLSKNAQYRKLRSEWKLNVKLAKSNIQGLGLFARRDIDKDQIVIEYIGEMIKNELADVREQAYNRQNRGCYMFRVDIFCVVDATRKGGFARYINHSCEPNCTAEIVNIEGKKKILIISQQKIVIGEELTYDYKFEYEDTACKIPCLCGSASCRKWMN